MAKSTEKTKNEIHIVNHGFYAYTKNLTSGLGLLILDKTVKIISGIKINHNKLEKFSMTYKNFEALLAYNIIQYVETVPKDVWKEMEIVYDKMN
jgi:hypothetical protein